MQNYVVVLLTMLRVMSPSPISSLKSRFFPIGLTALYVDQLQLKIDLPSCYVLQMHAPCTYCALGLQPTAHDVMLRGVL